MQQRRVVALDEPADVAYEGATEFEVRARAAIRDRGRFAVALSGGRTPDSMFTLLASPRFAEDIDWTNVHFFWSDERCVPPDDEHSNYGRARALLLDPIGADEHNVHRMRGEVEPHVSALDYGERLAAFFGDDIAFDAVFLGLGADGHTASLFPHSACLRVTDEPCVAVHVPANKSAPWRLTLTYQVLNAAHAAIFLVEGSEKAAVLAEVLEGPRDVERLPAQGIAPARGTLVWLADREAAARLSSHV